MTAVDLARLVEPLEWQDVRDQYECRKLIAPALGGHYMVVDIDRDSGVYSAGIDLGGLAFVMLLEPDKEYGGRKPRSFSTIESAQAAANADHADRVIAALDADLLAELVGALKGLSQAIGSSDDDFQAYTIAMDNGYTRARLTLAKLEAQP